MQSIIKLRAPIKIYNLNISYSSISGIEVLRYSTANVETHDSFGYGSSTYVYRFKHFFISCRRANVNHNVTHGTFMCTPCVRYTHTHSTMGHYTYRQKFLEKMYVSSRENTKVSIVLIALLVEIVLNT